MWIVRLALRRPYTFVVLALLIAVLGIVSVASMPIDIFPAINIPVVNVIWNYSGLSPTEMQDRIVTTSERAFTTTVTGIEHIESVSLRAVAVRRQGARGERRHRPRRALCPGALAPGCEQCDPESECHPAGRHGQDRDA